MVLIDNQLLFKYVYGGNQTTHRILTYTIGKSIAMSILFYLHTPVSLTSVHPNKHALTLNSYPPLPRCAQKLVSQIESHDVSPRRARSPKQRAEPARSTSPDR